MENNELSSIPTRNKKWYFIVRNIFLVVICFTILLVINFGHQTSVQRIRTFSLIRRQYQTNKAQLLESFICNANDTNRFPQSSTTLSNYSFDHYRRTTLKTYCDIVPIPTHDWTRAKTYTEKDIVFVIFTGAVFFHTRATATRDTWLSRITNYHFLSATPYPYLPITVVPNAGEDRLSNMKKLFYGLQMIYQKQMKTPPSRRQKWFYIAGCDTFILPHHLVKRLDGLDHNKPIFLGGRSRTHVCLGGSNKGKNVEFPSGGAGFFFSMKLFEMLQPHLTNFVEYIWPNTSEISDVALTCLINQLGVPLTKRAGFWANPPTRTLQEDGRAVFYRDSEPNDFHFIFPDEMYALDEFYVNQHMDRLINDENWKEFIDFTRRFVSSHYELLRKKRRECTLPKGIKAEFCTSEVPKYSEVPRSTEKYVEVPRSTVKSRKVRKSPKKYSEVPRTTEKYRSPLLSP